MLVNNDLIVLVIEDKSVSYPYLAEIKESEMEEILILFLQLLKLLMIYTNNLN